MTDCTRLKRQSTTTANTGTLYIVVDASNQPQMRIGPITYAPLPLCALIKGNRLRPDAKLWTPQKRQKGPVTEQYDNRWGAAQFSRQRTAPQLDSSTRK